MKYTVQTRYIGHEVVRVMEPFYQRGASLLNLRLLQITKLNTSHHLVALALAVHTRPARFYFTRFDTVGVTCRHSIFIQARSSKMSLEFVFLCQKRNSRHMVALKTWTESEH